MPTTADIVFKLDGELTAGELSEETQAVVDTFFGDLPYDDDREQSEFACSEGDLMNLETGRVV